MKQGFRIQESAAQAACGGALSLSNFSSNCCQKERPKEKNVKKRNFNQS